MNKEQRDAYIAFAKEKLGFEFDDIDLLFDVAVYGSADTQRLKKTAK